MPACCFIASRDQAGERARQAILAGCDTIFACGGDGTIHNIVQVLAGTHVALAVLPMGTANALAHDLGLPLDPWPRHEPPFARRPGV